MVEEQREERMWERPCSRGQRLFGEDIVEIKWFIGEGRFIWQEI